MRSIKIMEGLYAIHTGSVYFYIFITSDGIALFDTGTSPKAALHGFQTLKLNPDDVKHIFLTHSDTDHAGGLDAFPQAKRYLSKTEEPMINGTKARFIFTHNKHIADCLLLENNKTLTIGDTDVKIIYTPGHTVGSAVYLINKKYLITGDLLRLSKKGMVLPFYRLLNMNHQQNKKSIKDITPIIEKADFLLTAHSGYMSRQERAEKSGFVC